MPTLKLSPSLLEQYRVVRLGLYNAGPERLVEYITGEYVKSDAASRGSAYHELLEFGGSNYKCWFLTMGKKDGRWIPFDKVSKENQEKYKARLKGPFYRVYDKDLDKWWVFTEEAALPALNHHNEYKDMTREVWVDYTTRSHGFEILVRMKMDGLNAVRLREFKTTGRTPKYLTYFESIQWRCYLEALPEIEQVVYSIFKLNSRNTKCEEFTFEMFRDDQNSGLVQTEIDGFVHWLINNPQLLERKLMKEDRNPLPI